MGTDILPDSTVVSTELPRKKNIKNIALIFFIIGIIILSILWLVFSNKSKISHKLSTPKPDINFEQIEYTNSKVKNRVIGLAQKAQKENEPSKSYNDYQQVFTELSLVYDYNHDPKVRVALTELRDFLSKNYPKYFNQKNMNISCFDTKCSKAADLPWQVAEIIDEIKKNTTIDTVVKESILKELEAASFSSNKDSQWNHLIAVFNSLTSESRRTKKEDVKEIAVKMKDFLSSEYPENYKTHNKLFPDIFQL